MRSIFVVAGLIMAVLPANAFAGDSATAKLTVSATVVESAKLERLPTLLEVQEMMEMVESPEFNKRSTPCGAFVPTPATLTLVPGIEAGPCRTVDPTWFGLPTGTHVTLRTVKEGKTYLLEIDF